MKYAYFPGCSASSTGISYTISTDYVARAIGLELQEIPDWNCCGTSAARLTSTDLGLGLPARSLALAEKMDSTLDVLAPCAGCYASLKGVEHFARQSDANRRYVENLIAMPYEAKGNVVSLLEALVQPEAQELITAQVKTGLRGLKVACYYGCALVRPAGICNFDDVENPQSMDDLMELVGASPVKWAFKTECCGASNQIAAPQASRPLIERIFQNAAANGAEAIVTACPLCMMNLDMREGEINKTRSDAFDIPVYYFTELLGLSFGASAKEVGADRHFHPATAIFSPRTDKQAQSEEVLA